MNDIDRKNMAAEDAKPSPLEGVPDGADSDKAAPERAMVTLSQRTAAGVFCIIAAVYIATAMIIVALCSGGAPAGAEDYEQHYETVPIAEEAAHIHAWTDVTDVVHHEAVTDTIEHPATYDVVTSAHTVCNECELIIDNAAAEHIDATGHKGYTTGVPRDTTVKTADAWTETVTVTEAYDEPMLVGVICNECGAWAGATDGTMAE